MEGRAPVHELDTTYGYYFDGTYPATGTFLGASSGTCTFAPRAMVVSTRSPVDINLVNASGQQLQTTQQGTLALDQLPEPTTYYLGVDPAGYEDWDLVLPVDRYKVTLTGIATGSYTLTLTSFSASGTPIQTVVHGTTAPGQTSSPVAFSPPATVANRFRFTAGHAGDRIVLEVNVPGSGSIVAKAQTRARTSAGGAGRDPSGHGRTTIYGTASAAAHGKRRVRLVIRPGKAGRALARDGRLRVAVAVTFAPTGGLPRTEQRSVSV